MRYKKKIVLDLNRRIWFQMVHAVHADDHASAGSVHLLYDALIH